MKLNIKNVGACLLLGGTLLTATSCNDLLDLDPVSQITPDSFYKTADQLGAYMINYYGELQKRTSVTIIPVPNNASFINLPP